MYDCWQDTGKRLWHSQQVMPFMSWECLATSAYWGLISNLYGMTLAGQDLATHLFAPFLWLTFISPLHKQTSLYCASDTRVELGCSHWSSPRSKVLSLKCIIRLAQGACSVGNGMRTPPQDRMVSKLYAFQCRWGKMVFGGCHRWATPFLLSYWCHCD